MKIGSCSLLSSEPKMSSRNPAALMDYMLSNLTDLFLLLLSIYWSSRHTNHGPEKILAKTKGEKVTCYLLVTAPLEWLTQITCKDIHNQHVSDYVRWGKSCLTWCFGN